MKVTGLAANGRSRRRIASTLGRAVRRTAALLAAAAAPAALGAQDTAATSADSLRARLEQLEEAVALLRQQLAAQAAAEVRTRSRARLELGGRLAGTGFYATRRLNNLDVPQLVLPAPPADAGPAEGTLGATFRQSLLGAAVSGVRVGGAEVSADVDLDFAGGSQAGSGGRGTFPVPRLRTARAFLRGGLGELMAGHEVPLVLGLNPVSIASTTTPLFSNAGNLWLWLTQARVTRELLGGPCVEGGECGVRLALQAAVLAPNAGETLPNDPDAVDAAERARRPFLQARARLAWGEEGEVGVGVHRGWLRQGTALRQGGAVGADLRVPLGAFELRGEAYRGRLLRGLGGGGVGQNFGTATLPLAPAPVLRDQGGWAQLNVRVGEPWLGGAGCGVDDPENDDRAVRRRNLSCAAHLTWRPGGGWLVGAEAKRLGTEYATGTRWASHGAVVMGVEF